MNGAHDMGGRGGFGSVLAEMNEPVFHEAWEARFFALACLLDGGWTLDEDRHACENRSPAEYLKSSYYETWFAGLEKLAGEKKLFNSPPRAKPVGAPEVLPLQRVRGSYRRATGTNASFDIGQKVRVRNIQGLNHTRLPGYLRGHRGEIVRHHGAHVFPDSNAHGKGEDPRHLYTVKFCLADVFGGGQHDTIHADLWEPYLERI